MNFNKIKMMKNTIKNLNDLEKILVKEKQKTIDKAESSGNYKKRSSSKYNNKYSYSRSRSRSRKIWS